MAHEVLLEFLKLGLIDVSGVDERLDKLSQTAAEVTSAIKKNPVKAISFCLAALDPSIPAADPAITEVLGVLQHKWPTYPNAFSGVPVALVRAILLDALVAAAVEDDSVAVAFACLTRNMMPFVKAGNEQPVWSSAVVQIEQRVDERAAEEWTTPATISVDPFTFSTSNAGIKGELVRHVTDKEWLRSNIQNAFVTPQHGGKNPHHIQNNVVAWGQTASSLLSEAIAQTIDAVVGSVEFKGGDITNPFKELSDAISKYVESAVQSVAVAANGLERRTNLLWWREALYSTSARISYRDLPTTIAAALMAWDLSTQIPTFSPASVAAFLRETVCGLLQSQEDTYALRMLVEEARTSVELAALREAGTTLAPQLLGRGTLLAVIAQSEAALPEEMKFVELVGVSYHTKLRATEWAKWIYSELQALRAVQKRKAWKA